MRSFLALCFALAMLLGATRTARAYSTDVHFNLTYVQARLAGLARTDALWIALADESLDHNRTTSAYSGTIETTLQFLGLHRQIWTRNGERWQAYTDRGAPSNPLDGVLDSTQYTAPAQARAAVFARRDRLWQESLDILARSAPNQRVSQIRADIALGTFLHFEQDLYAHRQFGSDLDGQDWRPYGTFRGHAAEGFTPDYVALRPQLANEMFSASYAYFVQWQQRRGIKAPELPAQLVHGLIRHISAAYDPRALQYPAHRFRPWFPAQQELNRQISLALLSNDPPIAWANDLPNANSIKPLPYDAPDTSLRQIERRLEEPTLCPVELRLRSVMTDELLQ